jgi:C4-dicarboxylate-specific signal transduction histidine kinase
VDTSPPGPASRLRAPGRSWTFGVERLVRGWPIRRRILFLAALNSAIVVILAVLVWDGARVINEAWGDLDRARRSDRQLMSLDSEASGLQSLIHRYYSLPRPSVLAEIDARRDTLLADLNVPATDNPELAEAAGKLESIIESFLSSFDELRQVRADISRVYDEQVLAPARDMAGLYAIVDNATRNHDSLIWPALGKSREAYSAMLVATNAYYLSLAPDAAEEAIYNIDTITRTTPVMLDLADTALQKQALQALLGRAQQVRAGLAKLEERFSTQTRILSDGIDGKQAEMEAEIARLSASAREIERLARTRFDFALSEVYRRIAVVSVLFIAFITFAGFVISRSLIVPLYDLMTAMREIAAGNYDDRLGDFRGNDEIGEMAIAIEVFRGDAIARRKAEEEVLAAKEHAELALAELRETQRSLIDAEKLAALGGLVAGVAHEVNNPVGISLTVASSLQNRSEAFAEEVARNQLRRSRLAEFVENTREASQQLVGNLQRAAELIQSFKQVAVDRSQAGRREFDLREATDQIVSSLRPSLRKSPVALSVDIPDGIALDSYAGPYGQVLTNLVINATTHAFGDGRPGTIRIEGRRKGADRVEITFADDGVGMSDEVKRQAFDPFFTTQRGRGGTGLGLHIVYNLVTQRLGGRIGLVSKPGSGTSFLITLPIIARSDDETPPNGT